MTSPIFLIENESLTGSFEGFTHSLAQSPGELWFEILTTILC